MSKAYETGKGSWTHGQGTDYQNGIAFHRLLGPCPDCGTSTFDYGGGWRCNDPYCNKSYTNPAPNVGKAPDWWETDINVYLDGNAWCATGEGFTNIQESPCGFGRSPQEAVDKLRLELNK
jgi:hypothetical protein